MSEIKATKNLSKFVGVLSEKALECVEGETNGENDKKIPCEIIKGKITLETVNGTFPLRVYSASKKKDGTANKMFKGLKTIMDTYVSKLDVAKDSSLVADTIECNTKVSINDYPAQDGTINTGIQVSLNSAKRVNEDAESSTDLDLVGYIDNIVPELDKDEEETGRLVVTFISVGYGEKAEPFTLYVDEELADDFDEMYEKGNTCELYCSVAMKHVGAKQTAEAAFGRKAKVNSGFDVLEIQVVGGEPPYEEDDDDEDGNSKILSSKLIKELKKNRELYLENLKNDAKDKDKKEKKSAKKGLGDKKKIKESEDNEDDGDDDIF